MNKILLKDNQNIIYILVWLVCLVELNYFMIRGVSRDISSILVLFFIGPIINLLYFVFSSLIIGFQDKANRWPTRRFFFIFGGGFLATILGDILISSLF